MGAICCSNAKTINSTTLVDLPPPKIPLKDKLAAWELSQPFARCSMKAYMLHLEQAHTASGGQGSVELGQLIA